MGRPWLLLLCVCACASGAVAAGPAGYSKPECLLTNRVPSVPQNELQNCQRYLPSQSCCASVHDGDVGEHLSHTIDVGRGCFRVSLDRMPPSFAQFFCMACDPYQTKGGAYNKPWLKTFNDTSITDPSLRPGAADAVGVLGTAYLCDGMAKGLLPLVKDRTDGFTIYDACGFSLYTDDHGVVLWGDVGPDSGDDPVVPGQLWNAAEFPGGTLEMLNGKDGNFLRPPFLEQYNFSIVNVSACGGQAGLSEDSEACHYCFSSVGRALPSVALLLLCYVALAALV